jgi:hypothetical protein
MSDSMEDVKETPFETLERINPKLYRAYERAIEIVVAKNHDYAGTEDFYKNFRECESWGFPAWKGILVRLGDKWRRICNYAMKPIYLVKNESFEDTVLDMVNYLMLMLAMWDEWMQKNKPVEFSIRKSIE